VSLDVLGSDRKRSRLPAGVAGGAALLVVIGVLGDRARQNHEISVLRTCVSTAESDLSDLTRRAFGVEAYAGPSLTSPSVPASVRRSLAGLVEAGVARDLPRSRADRERCAGVGVLSWHGEVIDARRDYLRYLDLRLTQLSRATTNSDALHEAPMSAARAAAGSALARIGVDLLAISPLS
jgi:hypothetical protein